MTISTRLTVALLLGLTASLPSIVASAAPPRAASVAPSDAFRKLLPPLGPSRALPLPQVTETTLPNGLRVFVLEDHRQPIVWMEVAVPAGSVREPQDKVGLAAMVADLLGTGTTTRTHQQISNQFEMLGGGLQSVAEPDYFTVTVKGLSAYVDSLSHLFADVTLNPVFADSEVASYKVRTGIAIHAALADPDQLASLAMDRLIYGSFAYGNPTIGTVASIAGLTPADAGDFHRKYFTPNSAVLYLIGDITPAKASEIATGLFSAWPRADIPPLPPNPVIPVAQTSAIHPQVTLIDRPGAEQTSIRIGTIVPPYDTPLRFPGTAAAAVLGYGSMETRLMREIRVKRGLTYDISAAFARAEQAGSFEIATSTKNASTAEVVKLAFDVTQVLRKTPPPTPELSGRKGFMNGLLAVTIASPEDLLDQMVHATLYGKGPGDLTYYIPLTNAVTPKQVSEVLAALPLDTAAHVVLVGDAKVIGPQLVGLGPVQVIEPEQLDLLSPSLIHIAPPTSQAPVAPPVAPAAPTPASP